MNAVTRTFVLAVVGLAATPALAGVSGFAQLRQAQRAGALPACTLDACEAMVQEALAELLLEQRAGERLAFSLRVEAAHDAALADGRVEVREGFLDWAPTDDLDLTLGRQVLTWGVSDYLYVNDVFPKDYDAFFTGAGFDRMKVPVDAARLAMHGSAVGVEAVVSRSEADRIPSPARFAATAMLAAATPVDAADDATDAALKVSTNAGGWDLAGYAASFRSREAVFFMDLSGLQSDRPRLQHLGLSLTGNAAAGVVWVEAAVRETGRAQTNVVNRHFLGSAAKLIVGYSREVGLDVTASVQLQLEAATDHDRYAASLAPGVRPVEPVGSIVHARLVSRWLNQTLAVGAQAFAGNEGDMHLNPFASWSPADGWTLEAGANRFDGEPDSRYGAFDDDSNVYALARYSF